jgi:hypothetical protein
MLGQPPKLALSEVEGAVQPGVAGSCKKLGAEKSLWVAQRFNAAIKLPNSQRALANAL